MFFDNEIDVEKKFLESQSAFFKAAVFETFVELDLRNFLSKECAAEEIATNFGFKSKAVERFMNAVVSLNIAKKMTNGKFISTSDKVSYSSEGSILLFKLFHYKLPEILHKFKSMTAKEIIEKTDSEVVHLLEALVKYHLVQRDKENRYSNFPQLEKYIIPDSAKYIGPKINHYERVMFPMFSKKGLLGALKSGKSQWAEIFGEDVSNPFDIYKKNPQLLEDFTNGLHHLNTDDDKFLAGMLHLDAHTILDVGGGSGAWALQLLDNGNEKTQIDIYELPDAIPLLQKILKKYAPNENRIKYIAGSFMADPSSPFLESLSEKQVYDMISLGWILHDWKDETNILILKKVKSHLKPGGKLIMLETILPESKVSAATILDLAMLLQTEGCERTFEEYKKLLEMAGFTDISYKETPTRRQMITAG